MDYLCWVPWSHRGMRRIWNHQASGPMLTMDTGCESVPVDLSPHGLGSSRAVFQAGREGWGRRELRGLPGGTLTCRGTGQWPAAPPIPGNLAGPGGLGRLCPRGFQARRSARSGHRSRRGEEGRSLSHSRRAWGWDDLGCGGDTGVGR